MAKRSAYFSDEIEAIISPDPAGVESFSGRVGFLIGAAALVAAESSPALTVGEWCAVADVMNGMAHSHDMGAKAVLSGVWHSLYDSAPELDDKWTVDCEALARRLARSPIAEQLAVFEVGRKFWQTKAAEGETYAQLFSRLGGNLK